MTYMYNVFSASIVTDLRVVAWTVRVAVVDLTRQLALQLLQRLVLLRDDRQATRLTHLQVPHTTTRGCAITSLLSPVAPAGARSTPPSSFLARQVRAASLAPCSASSR